MMRATTDWRRAGDGTGMKRNTTALASLLLATLTACPLGDADIGSDDQTEASTESGATEGDPAATTTMGGSEGDPATTTGGDACPLGYSAGCCPGDGECCSCVLGCNEENQFVEDPETIALVECVCASDLCADACANECAGNGIGGDCEVCVLELGMGECMAEYLACQPG